MLETDDVEIQMPETIKAKLDDLQKAGSLSLEAQTLSHSVLPIAGFLSSLLLQHNGALIQLESIRVWPSNVDLYLVRSFFSYAIGEGRGVPDDGACYVLDDSDTEKLRSLLFMAFHFGWELSAWSLSGTTFVRVSNDGNVDVFVESSMSQILRKQFISATGRSLQRPGEP